MYVILTSKPGQFRTEISDDLQAVESYDYLCFGRKRAHFVIASLIRDAKITVIDESSPPVVNQVPSKFLTKFQTVEAARNELKSLTRFGGMDISLVKC